MAVGPDGSGGRCGGGEGGGCAGGGGRGGERIEVGVWVGGVRQIVVVLPGTVGHIEALEILEVLEVLEVLEELVVIQGHWRPSPLAPEEAYGAPSAGEWRRAFVRDGEDFFALGVLDIVSAGDGWGKRDGGEVAVLARSQGLSGCGGRQVAHSDRLESV